MYRGSYEYIKATEGAWLEALDFDGFDPSRYLSGGDHKHYFKGWAPSRDKHFYDLRPTIRDIGRGSARNSNYLRYSSEAHPQPQDEDNTAVPEVLSYEHIRRSCLDSGILWEDPDFPAADSSLFFKNPPSAWPGIEWRRPHEICRHPKLFKEGASRLDVNQGILGDCWLLAAVASLASSERLLHRVIPYEQSFTDNYAGIFRFQFWQYGRWVEVCIDDRLPTCQGKLIYMHSNNRDEFWSALLEKAFAKLNGTYENLSGGLTSEAMTDFTGGVVERYDLRGAQPDDLFDLAITGLSKGALMGCSIDSSPDTMESTLDNGLVIGHAYSVTACRYVTVNTRRVSGRIQLVRLRNPWGNDAEWNGAWSDQSEEWCLISDEEKQEMGLTFEKDGEFWMSYKDWVEQFQKTEICNLGPDSLIPGDDGEVVDEIKQWEGRLMEGCWRQRVNAGGCRNYPETFWTNPQYRISIDEPDNDNENGQACIIVGLMQKDRRKLRHEGLDNLTIGYAIYMLENPECGTLDYQYFTTHRAVAKSSSFINLREVCDHHMLDPGHYVIVPSTFEPDQPGEFILRIFSQAKDKISELDNKTGKGEPKISILPSDTEADSQSTEEAVQAFNNICGYDGEIDAYQLLDILNEIYARGFNCDEFTADITRSMVAMFDDEFTGKLNFEDFQKLWNELQEAKKVFFMFDKDNRGYFNSYEFRNLLSMLGLRLSNSTFNAIVMRYSDEDGHVQFDDFISCAIKLKIMFEIYDEKDASGDAEANFSLDEFVQLTMYS